MGAPGSLAPLPTNVLRTELKLISKALYDLQKRTEHGREMIRTEIHRVNKFALHVEQEPVSSLLGQRHPVYVDNSCTDSPARSPAAELD